MGHRVVSDLALHTYTLHQTHGRIHIFLKKGSKSAEQNLFLFHAFFLPTMQLDLIHLTV